MTTRQISPPRCVPQGSTSTGSRTTRTGEEMTDAVDEWIVINGMGGYVCGDCGIPVESEPCEAHQPTKYARAHGTLRVPVSLFERVEGCFACENRAGLPIPLGEFPSDGDIGLCIRHWNWWLTHFASLSPDREPPEAPCSAHLLESEIAREHAALRPGSEDRVRPPMPVGHMRACGCPECVAWLEAQRSGDPS